VSSAGESSHKVYYVKCVMRADAHLMMFCQEKLNVLTSSSTECRPWGLETLIVRGYGVLIIDRYYSLRILSIVRAILIGTINWTSPDGVC
jgi:hypothetical protein